ncbi:SDR family oxidoreductase [Undibacterium sp. CY18W]|uniref:SDR family oxidoreductase n=1 Tax=Undibacterium hunanense TaxID=2762292 RepID=A0ABR6ZW93_9BURK|nr:SDR family oxidoreductase [Undibacterium hunanense]MBC3919934.1 SDR family oxidoreductase [Undibacterium hunanense]
MKQVILLTGASGFVGQAIAQACLQQDVKLICPTRQALQWQAAQLSNLIITDLTADTDWSASLTGVDIVIHCAARVHVMQETAADPLLLFRQLNVDASLNLARQAAAAGAKQFIYLSSVKVNGEATAPGHPYTADDQAAPQDAYGISKHEAEQALLDLGRQTGMAITIIRPPLVYGPGVKANFLSMLRMVRRGLPLPLGSIRNQRSFVYLGNLVSLVLHCRLHEQARHQVFLASDGRDLSTTELLNLCAQALQVKSRLFPFPASLLTLAASVLGKKNVADRLCQSLQVDISKTRNLLGWSPPYTVEQGLQATAAAIRT